MRRGRSGRSSTHRNGRNCGPPNRRKSPRAPPNPTVNPRSERPAKLTGRGTRRNPSGGDTCGDVRSFLVTMICGQLELRYRLAGDLDVRTKPARSRSDHAVGGKPTRTAGAARRRGAEAARQHSTPARAGPPRVPRVAGTPARSTGERGAGAGYAPPALRGNPARERSRHCEPDPGQSDSTPYPPPSVAVRARHSGRSEPVSELASSSGRTARLSAPRRARVLRDRAYPARPVRLAVAHSRCATHRLRGAAVAVGVPGPEG
jgi:hypothetical protein